MSVLTYIASNCPLPEKHFPEDFSVHFNLDTGVIDDGGQDDGFELIPCMNYDGVFTEKKYAVALEWYYYTEVRAQKVIETIRETLRQTGEVELWHIWMGSGERPLIRSRTLSIDELTPKMFQAFLGSDVTEEFHEIPIQYRLVITAK